MPVSDRSQRKERALVLLARLAEVEEEAEAMEAKVDEEEEVATAAAEDDVLHGVTLDDVHGALGLTALGGQWSDALQVMHLVYLQVSSRACLLQFACFFNLLSCLAYSYSLAGLRTRSLGDALAPTLPPARHAQAHDVLITHLGG